MTRFFDLTMPEMEDALADRGMSRQHAKSLYGRVYRQLESNPWEGEGLPTRFRDSFPETFIRLPVSISEAHRSRYDQTVKFLLRLEDQYEIEMVLIPEKARITLCVSSQVGCRQACSFCHTGRMGLKRSLTSGEIVGQVYLANRWIKEHPEWFASLHSESAPRISNIVFMGMGEPLDNVESVARAIHVLTHARGFNLGLRKISVSTAGHLEGLDRLLSLIPNVPIAISLHSPFDGERSRLMPINRRWSIAKLMEAIDDVHARSGRDVLIQYTMIRGVNDSPEHANALRDLLKDKAVKVNLIPLNEIEPSQFQSPLPESVQAFRDVLHHAGIRSMIRYSKGQDIGGACGQLVS